MHKIWFERTMPPQFAPLLEGFAEPIGPANLTPDDPFAAIPQAEGVIASSILYYTAEVMERAPQLKVISRTGIGTDRIDIPAATEHGIAICNAPDGPTISTAEHALTLMMAVAKHIKQAERRLREGGSDFFKDHFGIELYEKTLGLVGFGRIARHVARGAQGLGMKVVTYDPYVGADEVAAEGAIPVGSLEDLLQSADVVSLHVPLSESTRHLINAERLKMMKPNAIFINTARGGLVDEAALINVLKSGHLFGAGLDVTDPEPAPVDNPLLQMENVIVTPHVAGATYVGKDRLYQIAISQVLQVLRGERPPNLVNPEVWERRRK